jgi:hypothetical protein
MMRITLQVASCIGMFEVKKEGSLILPNFREKMGF